MPSLSTESPAKLGGSRSFPLPDDFFPALSMTAAETQQLEDKVTRIVADALVEYNVHESVGPLAKLGAGWTQLARAGDLTTIRRKDARACHTRMFGSINADFRHFMDFFYAETACELFEWNQFMFGYAVDAAVLRNIDTVVAGKRHLYMGIKWVCLQPSALARKRDECFLEYMVYTKDLRGRDVGVRVTIPLDLPQCPALPRAMKVKRLKTHSVVIVRPVEGKQAKAQLFMMCDSDLHDHIGSTKYNKQLMAVLRDMSMFSDSKRLTTQGLACRTNWVPNRSRRSCGICSRRFHPGRRRSHCRLCGDVFCKKCVVLRDAPGKSLNSGSRRTFHTVKTKFCKMCVTKTRESDMGVLAVVPAASIRVTTATVAATSSAESAVSISNEETQVETSRISWWSETETGNWKEQTFRFSVASAVTSTSTAASSDDRASTSTRLTLTMAVAPRKSSSTGSPLPAANDFGSYLDSLIAVTACSETVAEGSEESDADKRSYSFEIVDTGSMAPASLANSKQWPEDSEQDSLRDSRVRNRFVSTPVQPVYSKTQATRGNCRRTASVGSRRNKSRSLSACLAEQEELLRRMVMAASGGFDPAKTMPVRKQQNFRGEDELYEL
jgi:hypothetical protein